MATNKLTDLLKSIPQAKTQKEAKQNISSLASLIKGKVDDLPKAILPKKSTANNLAEVLKTNTPGDDNVFRSERSLGPINLGPSLSGLLDVIEGKGPDLTADERTEQLLTKKEAEGGAVERGYVRGTNVLKSLANLPAAALGLKDGVEARKILKEREDKGMSTGLLEKASTLFPIINKSIVDAEKDVQESRDERNLLLYTVNNALTKGLQTIGSITPGAYLFTGAASVGQEAGLGTEDFLEKGDSFALSSIKNGFKKVGIDDSTSEQLSEALWNGINIGAAFLGSKKRQQINNKAKTKAPKTKTVKGKTVIPKSLSNAKIKGILIEGLIQDLPQIVAGMGGLLTEDGGDVSNFKKATDALSQNTSAFLAGMLPGVTFKGLPNSKGNVKAEVKPTEIVKPTETVKPTEVIKRDKSAKSKKIPKKTLAKILKEAPKTKLKEVPKEPLKPIPEPQKTTAEPSLKEVLIADSEKTEQPFGELKEKTETQKLLDKDINNKELEFELGIVQKGLAKIPLVRDITKIGSKAFIDIRNKLNNVLVKFDGELQGLGDTITGIGGRKKQIVEQSVKDFGIEDLTNWAKKNATELSSTKKVLEQKLKTLFGEDKVGYEVAKSHLNKQYYENIYKDKDLDNLRFISNAFFYLKDFNGKDISKDLPENIQNKLKELEDTFSVRYDEEGVVLNPNSKEHLMTSELGEVLEEKGLLRYKKDGYKRGVINKEIFNWIKKNQKKLGLEDVEDFQAFIKKGYDTTINQSGDIPKWMSSILKRSKALEKYHSQDPITRMISYADEVGQLVTNKETVDVVNQARGDKDINRYIGKDADNFVRKSLGLHDISKTAKNVGKAVGGLGMTAVIGNLPLLAQSTAGTTNRFTPVFFRNILGLRFKNDINKSAAFLEKSGIEQKFDNNGFIKKILGESYSLFGGGVFDKKAKGLLTSMIMREQLRAKGAVLKKGDDLVESYQKLLDGEPTGVSNKLLSSLGRQLNDISDFSDLSRGQISGLDSRIFNTFKNFGRTTASRYMSYPTQVINEVYSTFKNNLSKKDLADRSYQKISFLVADSLGLAITAKLVVDKIMGDDSDEEKKKLLADKLAGGSVKEKLAMLLSYPLQQPGISMASGTFNNIVKLAEDFSNNGINKGQIDNTKISGLVRQLSLLMKEKELTTGGNYKYSNEWSDNTIQNTLKFVLGFSDGKLDYEKARDSIEKVSEEDKGLIAGVVDKIINNQNYFQSGLGETFDILKYGAGDRDSENEFYNFKVRSESKKNLDTLLSNIQANKDEPLSVDEWIVNAWDGFDIKVDGKDIDGFLKSNLSTNKSVQKALLETIDELGINNDPLYKGDMNIYMDELKTKNPALFYQIMKKVINPIIVKIDDNKKTIKELEFTGQETGASFVDEILVDRYEDLPRISSDIANRFSKIIESDPTEENLESYEQLLETTKQLPYLYDDIKDSIATTIGDKLKQIEGISELLEGKDNIKEMVKQALVLRGMKFDLTDNNNELGAINTTSGEVKTTPTELLQLPTSKTNELVDLLKLKPQSSQIDPLFKDEKGGNSLTDILLQ